MLQFLVLIIIFYGDNCKNNFLLLGHGLTLVEALVHQKKYLVSTLIKQRQKCCLSLHYNGDNGYLFVNRKEIINLKSIIKMLTFQLIFV